MSSKVLMFGWEFPPQISGGLGTACLGLTQSLAKQDVKIIFVMPKASGLENKQIVDIVDASKVNLPKEFVGDIEQHIEYLWIRSALLPYNKIEDFATKDSYLINDTKTSHDYACYPFMGGYGRNLMEEVYQYARVAQIVAKQKEFDVIHGHDWLTYPAAVTAKRISGKPLVIHVHATEYDRSGENINPRVWKIEKMGMDNADRIITVSNRTRDIVIQRYGINPDKVQTVYNGVNFSSRKQKTESPFREKIVTFLGRITYQKGPEYFIEAASKVAKKCPDVRFVMAGSGDMLYKSIRRVAQLKLGTHFHFTGFLSGDYVANMYAMSDVYVMPSVSEPFGISPLEAIRSGVPTIISKQSGVAEVLKYALKIDFWDVDSMADAIYGLINYPVLAEFISKYALEEVDQLSWNDAAHEIKEIYKSLI